MLSSSWNLGSKGTDHHIFGSQSSAPSDAGSQNTARKNEGETGHGAQNSGNSSGLEEDQTKFYYEIKI